MALIDLLEQITAAVDRKQYDVDVKEGFIPTDHRSLFDKLNTALEEQHYSGYLVI